jgi:hypothetical protein
MSLDRRLAEVVAVGQREQLRVERAGEKRGEEERAACLQKMLGGRDARHDER